LLLRSHPANPTAAAATSNAAAARLHLTSVRRVINNFLVATVSLAAPEHSGNQRHNEQHQKDHEQHLGNFSRADRYSGKAEESCDYRHYEEHRCVVQHLQSFPLVSEQ
jgi:hypothetical protein